MLFGKEKNFDEMIVKTIRNNFTKMNVQQQQNSIGHMIEAIVFFFKLILLL